jgi:hypothetical protein
LPAVGTVQSEVADTVTHQGCSAPVVDATVSVVAVTAAAMPARPVGWRCSCCGQPLVPYVRRDFLRRAQGRDRYP